MRPLPDPVTGQRPRRADANIAMPFGHFHELGLVGKPLKQRHRPSYYLLTWGIVIGLVYWAVRF